MKRSRFTVSQILAVLKPAEFGTAVPGARDQLGDVLYVAPQIRRHGRVADDPDEGA
jgi:hypothetical protein